MRLSVRQRIFLLLLLALVLGAAYVTLHFFYQGGKDSHHLYEPKLLAVRVGGVPATGEGTGPVEVFQGLPITVSCEVVPLTEESEKPAYALTGLGAERSLPECRADVTFDSPLREQIDLAIEYRAVFPDGSTRLVDKKGFTVRSVPHEEFLRIRSLETASQAPVTTLTVPQLVIPYVDAALELKGKGKDYAVVFFVRRLGAPELVLQIHVPGDDPAQYQVVTAPLKRFREWGGGIGGFAAWPGGHEPGSGEIPPPIRIGSDEDMRQVFEIFAVVIRASDMATVRDKAIAVEPAGADRLEVTVANLTLDDLRSMAYKGWVSPPLRVVRAEHSPGESRAIWSVKP